MRKIQKILIVDDDYVALFLAKETVRSAFREAAVFTAGNVDLALETIKENPEDEFMILLSLDMRFKNGEHFLQAFSSIGNPSVVYLVSPTAANNAELMQSYSFVRGYLRKPLTLKDLRTVRPDVGPLAMI